MLLYHFLRCCPRLQDGNWLIAMSMGYPSETEGEEVGGQVISFSGSDAQVAPSLMITIHW